MNVNKHTVDYSNNFKLINLVVQNAKGYATINEVFFSEEGGIEPSGEFFIYLLHPILGTRMFRMRYDYDYNTWVPTDLVIRELIGEEILQQVIDAMPVKEITKNY